jgi:glyoxalase family protein
MSLQIQGIHHITALAGDPQRNADFYTSALGLRLVKKTVNFDAPDVYHLYYGDTAGTPGTLLTFFPFPGATRGRRGTGEISAVAFTVPPSSLNFWVHRFSALDIHVDGPEQRFGSEILTIQDPDGMCVELVPGTSVDPVQPSGDGSVPEEYAITRFTGATMTLAALEPTDEILRNLLGLRVAGREAGRTRYVTNGGRSPAAIDLIINPEGPPARASAGSVHHLAWRTNDDETQHRWRTRVESSGLAATEIVDRQYFKSIYFREPGGVLFEIATDGPGFTVDEPSGQLGSSLMLPPWLEAHRSQIERVLPPIHVPSLQDVVR